MPRRDNRPPERAPNARRATPVERAPPALPPQLGVTVTGPALCEGSPVWVAGSGRFANAKASGQVPSPIEYTVPQVGAEDCPAGPPPGRNPRFPAQTRRPAAEHGCGLETTAESTYTEHWFTARPGLDPRLMLAHFAGNGRQTSRPGLCAARTEATGTFEPRRKDRTVRSGRAGPTPPRMWTCKAVQVSRPGIGRCG